MRCGCTRLRVPAPGSGWLLSKQSVGVLGGETGKVSSAPLPQNTKMAPTLGAAKYRAYNACPKAVRLLLRVQKILINHWLFKLNHLELIWLMRKKKMNWTLLFSSTETYEISCSLESISVHTSLAPLCKIPYLCLISLSLIKATEFSIFMLAVLSAWNLANSSTIGNKAQRLKFIFIVFFQLLFFLLLSCMDGFIWCSDDL